MVNSSSYDDLSRQHQTQDRNAKAEFKQPYNVLSESKHPSSSCNKSFSETADTDIPTGAFAIEPVPTKTEFNSDMSSENSVNIEENSDLQVSTISEDLNASICCSVPLDRVQGVLTRFHLPKPDEDTPKAKTTRKLLCLYCDRSFVSANLRQKHVERVHSVKQNRRVSSRRHNQQLTASPCVYCDKLNSTEKTLKDLFHHLINDHSNKYFGCLPCEQRFLSASHLTDHNTLKHELSIPETTANLQSSPATSSKATSKSLPPEDIIDKEEGKTEQIPVKVTRSKTKPKSEEPTVSEIEKVKKLVTKKKSVKLKELINKKLSVKSSKITIRRRESKRIQAIAKLNETPKRKRSKPSEKKTGTIKPKPEQSDSTNTTEKSSKTVPTCINPYPEFDCFYRVKKITDHSIDNLKISSLTFDDVFDKAFFNRIKCNIEENLLHHIDGKLFKNKESENRISNFEKISNQPQESQNSSSENYGCEISLNAVTPVASLSLNSQYGEDFESQIEYGSKPSKKKTQTKTDEVFHYKYFTRRKFQASILQHKENRDLSKLDMWTQLIIKKRQQKMLDDQKSAKEIQEYTAGDEYKSRIKREELNRILDRRGPFEDLKEEASKKVALDKLNSDSEDGVSHESFSEVREVLNEILNRVFTETACLENAVEEVVEKAVNVRIDVREIPSYLNLRQSSSFSNDEIDRSDKITLICSSQETENFELPTNQVRGKNEIIELSGEWARCRMYICAACGAKLPNMKYLMEHKSLYHQNVWVQHYEFVGNQSELYRHLSIPALGKVGAVEERIPCKVWKRSDARTCTKCGKQCNSLGELHRHILECGGDWTWMLARKKCKYRPFGAKSRRKRRGLIHRVHIKRKTEPTEKKKYKKTFDGPRQRPSDADSIQRMLANLPAKRSTRKLISLQDGIYRARKKTQINPPINKRNKVKCGKVIYKSQNIKETTEKTLNTTRVNLANITQKNSNSTSRRTLRSLNKVLASRIIDSNPKLSVKRKLRVINDKRRTRKCQLIKQDQNEDVFKTENSTESVSSLPKTNNSEKLNKDDESPDKRSSLRSQGKSMKKLSMKQLLTGKINIKSFFPIKKRKNKKNIIDLEGELESTTDDTLKKNMRNEPDVPNVDESNNVFEDKKVDIDVSKEPKKKKDTFGKLVKSFSMRRKNINKLKKQNDSSKSSEGVVTKENLTCDKGKRTNAKCINENNSNNKRKLKQNFRNVINRVKKLKIDSESPSSSTVIPIETMKIQYENPPKDAFLDKSKLNDKLDPCAPPEKIVIPSMSETRENSADISETAPIVIKFNETEDDPHIPERIFRFESNNEKNLQAKGELNFDTQPVKISTDQNSSVPTPTDSNTSKITQQGSEMQPISIETSVKPKIVPLVSPNMKGKIRKPTRGLNDCIAMLTSKLQQKTEQTDSNNKSLPKSESCLNLSHSSNIFRPFNEVSVPKLDCILKIPSFKTNYSGTEETALDLSMKSQSNPELNRKPQQENFWQTRKLDFSLPIGYVKPMWTPTTPLPKPNSVDQTIEEVIEGYPKKTEQEATMKPQWQWNSVDNIIQSVINGYKDTPVVLKDKKVPNTKNSIDDIIEFVIAKTRVGDGKDMKNPVEHDETLIYDNSHINEGKNSNSNLGLPVNEVNNTEIVRAGKELLSKLQVDGETPCQNNVKTTKKRVRRKNKQTDDVSSLKIVEKTLLVDEEKSTLLETVAVNLEPGSENGNDVTEENINTLMKCNGDSNVSQVLENAEVLQESFSLNTGFVHSSDNKTGNNVNPKRGRKLGQVRKNNLKKKGITGKILETNVDNLLNFEEVTKSNVSVTNLGTVSTAEVQEPDIKLTTEDEPHLLENKVLLAKNKNVIPSDSEDEIPLSILRQTENLVENSDCIEKREKLSVSEQKLEQAISESDINENIDQSVNIEIEVVKSNKKVVADQDNTTVNGDVTIENSKQIEKSNQKGETTGSKFEQTNETVSVIVELENTKELPECNLINKSICSTQVISNEKGSNDQEEISETKSAENEESSKQSLNIIREKCIKEVPSTEQAADNIISSANSESLTKQTFSKTFTNTSTVVFKTPKKVRKFSRKPVSKRRTAGRRLKVGESSKNSLPFDKAVAAENSEADTDDESLLSIKMSLSLKRGIAGSIPETNTTVQEAEENITIINNDSRVKNNVINCNENSSITNKTSLSNQNKSNDEISGIPPIDEPDINEFSVHVEKHKEDKSFKLTSQNDTSSLIFDKSDTNNFFDSGISDESLENLEQQEKLISLPKKRGKKSKASRTNSKSSIQIFVENEYDHPNKDGSIRQKVNITESQDDFLINRSSTLHQRNSEMELSDGTNSISDISNDKISETQQNHDAESISPSSPSPSTTVYEKQTRDFSIKDPTVPGNLHEKNLTKGDTEIGVISDLAVIIDNKKELDYLFSVEPIIPPCAEIQKSNANEIPKTKIKNSKTRFFNKRKSKVKKSNLTKQFKEPLKTDPIEVIPIETEALNNLEQPNPLPIGKRSNDVDNDVVGNSSTNLLEATTNREIDIVEADQNTKQSKSIQNISQPNREVVKRSKSLKSSKTSSNNLSKRSLSLSHTEISQLEMKPEEPDKVVNETVNIVRKSRATFRRGSKSTSQENVSHINDENKFEREEKIVDGDLPGRRPRSARNKVVSYAETDYNEITDSSTPQEISPENSPGTVSCEEVKNTSNLLKIAERKLSITDKKLPVEENIILERGANILFTKRKLRKRRTKRKEKFLRKIRINKKFKKPTEKKSNEDAVENSIVAQELDQLTKENISVECSLESANENTDDFTNNIVSNGNNSDYVDSLEKNLGKDQKLLPLSKTSVITENLDIREPPIKIIINKQKTRRKSKSFKKINSKSQNDLFKDFALVIKKPKRLAPIITFTPTDSILKETYPNLVTSRAEPVVGCEESEDKRKIPEENLDESVEEMDMELDEIPINTNIIERNMLPEVTDIKTFVEETSGLNNNVKTNIKHLKSRKAKKKSARFTKKKSKVPIVTGSLNLFENVDTLSECPKKTEISLDSLSENNSFGDIIEINISDQISFHTDIEANIKPKSCDDNKHEESIITKLTEDAEELKNDNLGASMNEFSGLFTLSNEEMEQESILRITKTVTGKKNKKGKAGRKKIMMNFKNKDFVENSQECSVLDEHKSELSHKTSVNNNLLSPAETKITPVVTNEILPNESVLGAIVETQKAVSSTQLVKNSIKPERTIRSDVFNENLFKSFGNSEVSHDNQETLTEKTHEFEFRMKPSSTPIKKNSFNLVTTKYTEEQDSENIYTFNENDDFEIDKTPELCKRLPRRKFTSLSEPEVLQKNNDCDSLKDDDNVRESLFNQRRLSRRKDSTFSETVELLEKNNHTDVSKEFIEYRNTHISDSSNSKKNSSESKSVEILEVQETNVDICSSEPVENILLDNTGEFEVNNSGKDNTPTSKLNEDKDAKDQKELENEGKQENKVELESTRRKSMRSAKVKALEHIHDEALAELTESQRNRELNRSKVSSQEEDEEEVAINGKKNLNRKTKKNQKNPKLSQTLDIDNKVLEEDKPPSFADLVADLAGLEELENSIERELSAGDDNFVIEKQNDLNITANLLTEENIGKLNDTPELDNQELRRSRRGSRKIASYNENDLLDPIIDVVDKKKKNRKKDLTDSITQDDVKTKKTKEEEKKLNSDELFDLLKTSKIEKLLPSDSQNSFAGTLNKYRENSESDKHEDLLPKVSDFTGQVNDATVFEKINSKDAEKIYEFTESHESSEPIFFPQKGQKRKAEKTLSAENAENSTSSISFQDPSNLENSTEQLTKIGAKDFNYCEICNKSFIRIENLIKHKRTLTHIQKLSELEAKQAEEKSKLDQITSEENSKLNSEESPITFESSLSDINIHNILLKSEKPNKTVLPIVHSSFPNNDSLKLVDIISDVLNKPSLATIRDDDSSFVDSQSQNENQPELRRYKSLGERKSFDSDNVSNSDHNSLPIGEPYLSKTTILEKQISLLENIIENQTGISYIDDISMSSNNSAIETSVFSSKQEDSNLPLSKDKNDTLITMDSSFLKPTQYEEISEDSVNIRNYEDQKLRKTLNRDEELFLECCSLLKSGSEVSSYSNQRSQKVINRLGMRQFDEPESMENKSLVQEPNYNLENDFSDGNSRIPTPLGDSYDDDASDSNTISSNWDINKMEPVFEDNPNITSNLNFQEVLNKAIHQDKVEILSNFRKSSGDEDEVDSIYSNNKKEGKPEASANKKKIITKGARKVFEGLKVSIPTEEINLEEVLNCSPKCKKVELQLLQSTSDDQSISENSSPQKPSRNARKSKPVKKAQVGSNLLFKVKKKKSLLSPGNTTSTNQDKDNTKSIDVYDFEETQDNSDVFPKPDFRAFRCKKSTENLADLESDTESRDDYLEPFIAQPESVTSSLSSSSSIKKPKAHESITKKKCMIMGRIFKNQAKSKIEDIDEEMRDIPIINNEELVENYVANCKIIKNEMKPKLTETEINQLFDQLLETNEKDDHSVTVTKSNPKLRPENIKEREKKVPDNRKKKFKNRKRARTNSESTDDEFNLNKSTKRIYRKNGKAEDNSINLEQELKECIGVASRKSQRKCTSGKQNVLVEYWSSDESQFEALLESQRIDHKSKQQNKVSEPKVLKYPESVPPEQVISIVKSNTEFEKVPTILKPPPRPKVKKLQVKRKHTGSKDKTINLNVTINSNKSSDQAGINRRKRAAANPLYHWSSSSEDESQDLIEVKPIREDDEELEDDRPIQHGWIVGESPKKLVTMLAQAKGKKLIDVDCVKEQGKKRTNNSNS